MVIKSYLMSNDVNCKLRRLFCRSKESDFDLSENDSIGAGPRMHQRITNISSGRIRSFLYHPISYVIEQVISIANTLLKLYNFSGVHQGREDADT